MGKGGKSQSESRVFSRAEVAKHSTEKDCWLVIRGRVFDVSKWDEHPGGKVLFTHAGQDASAVFQSFHSGAAYSHLDKYLIGECKEASPETGFEAEYSKIVAEAVNRGLFKSNKLFYAFKLASLFAWLGAAWAVLAWAPHNMAATLIAAVLVSICWQQCGWLAHDFAHHQVFKTRRYNDYMATFICCLAGYSLNWWKNQHNTHHAIPNLHESEYDAHDGDPDIDTLPFLAWSRRLAMKTVGPRASALAHALVLRQQWIYFPLLLFARLVWVAQSFSYAFRVNAFYWDVKAAPAAAGSSSPEKKLAPAPAGLALDCVALAVHYSWVLALMLRYMTLPGAVAFFLTSQLLAGLLIAIVFGVGHNAMTVYDADKKPGFAEHQVTTTRNIDDGPFISWFMGGLQFQVEYHLFPTMPRHNLPAARALVEPLCRRYGVLYHSTSLWRGTAEVLGHLAQVATDLCKHGPQ